MCVTVCVLTLAHICITDDFRIELVLKCFRVVMCHQPILQFVGLIASLCMICSLLLWNADHRMVNHTSRPQVSAQVSTLSAQLASNLQEMGMANATVDSLSSTVISYGPSSSPAVSDALAGSVGALCGLFLLLFCSLTWVRCRSASLAVLKPEPPMLKSMEPQQEHAPLLNFDSTPSHIGKPRAGLQLQWQPYSVSGDLVIVSTRDSGNA
jgi:hypothetical protein